MTGDRPPEPTASEEPSEDAGAPEEAAGIEAPVDGPPAAPQVTPPEDSPAAPETTEPPPAEEPATVEQPVDAAAAAQEQAPQATTPEEGPTSPTAPEEAVPADVVTAPKDNVGGQEAAAATPDTPAPAPKPRPKRPPRPREPLPWPELRAAATSVSEGVDVEDLKELFRLLPNDIREQTVEAVREYRKGARRPVSAYAGKSLARAVHTARRARRRPDSDDAVSEAIGQALAAEVIASLDVEVAAEVILPKRDLLERESRNARRRQKAEDDRTRDERRRRAREENQSQGATYGTYSGAKIRGLDELAKLFDSDEKK